jgi:ABC-2 type transport system permease protein
VSPVLFLKEMKRNRGRFAAWAATMAAFIVITSAMIPTMLGGAATTASYLKMFPKSMLDAFGMDLTSWSSTLGMYATYHVFYALLFGGVFAISLGGDILSKEESRKTADFLLTRPISRSTVVASKLAALVAYVLAMDVVVAATGWISLSAFSSQPWSRHAYLVLNVESSLLSLLFASLGLFISVLGRRARSSTGVGSGVILGAYFIDAFARASAKYRDLGWLSPFRFVDTRVTAPDYGVEWWRVLYLAGVPILLCALTFAVYRRKDILV